MTKDELKKVPKFFEKYISTVKETNLISALINQLEDFKTFLRFIPTNKELYQYEENKWTIKEVIQHIIDCERIFAYRALCFARKENQTLLTFEENDYSANSNANSRDITNIIHEFEIVRQSTICLFKSFNEEQYLHFGKSENMTTNALALGFTIVGHCNHHQKILQEKYL